jgi:predicted metalloprotease
MRFGGGRESSNFEDATGRSGGGFGGGMGGGGLGCLIPLIASRFGIGGVVVLVIGYFLLSSLGGRYTPTTLVAYSQAYQSGCGAAQSAMGPFYCPTDKKIYLDTAFFTELSRRFQAPGDFAQAYVIAHEVGHHVQDLTGTLDTAHEAQARSSRTEGNAIQVKVELQADCYAGVWAAHAKAPDGTPAMEQGDFEEGMRAAEAIGDDTLQRQTQGRVVPDSFTHGSSAERMEALQRGFKSGDPAVCRF